MPPSVPLARFARKVAGKDFERMAMKLRTFLVLGAVGLATGSLMLESADAAPFNPAK